MKFLGLLHGPHPQKVRPPWHPPQAPQEVGQEPKRVCALNPELTPQNRSLPLLGRSIETALPPTRPIPAGSQRPARERRL